MEVVLCQQKKGYICEQKTKLFPELIPYEFFFTGCFSIFFVCVIQCVSMGYSNKAQMKYLIK